MALTISEDFRMTAGGKAFRFMKITHDESTSTITAASMDLDYIDFVGDLGTYYSSDIASVAMRVVLSIITENTAIDFGLPAKAASTTRFFVIGW